MFPAARYLQPVTRDHHRRLTLQHWLLLLVSTLLILALVPRGRRPDRAAASGWPGTRQRRSRSSSTIRRARRGHRWNAGAGPTPRGRARGARQGDDRRRDLAADGGRRGPPCAYRAAPRDRRFPGAVRDPARPGCRPRRGQGHPRQPVAARGDRIALRSPGQRALPAEVELPLVVGMPDLVSPPNLGVAALDPGPQPWSPGINRVRVRLLGDSGRSSPMALLIGNRSSRPQLGSVGTVVEARLEAPTPGWWPVTAEIDADEFRADDRRSTLVRVVPVARGAVGPRRSLPRRGGGDAARGRPPGGWERGHAWLAGPRRVCCSSPPRTSPQSARSIARSSGAASPGVSAVPWSRLNAPTAARCWRRRPSPAASDWCTWAARRAASRPPCRVIRGSSAPATWC